MKRRRESTHTFVVAGGMVFLIVVSVYDRDPTPFTWLLVLGFLAIFVTGVRQRSKGK